MTPSDDKTVPLTEAEQIVWKLGEQLRDALAERDRLKAGIVNALNQIDCPSIKADPVGNDGLREVAVKYLREALND